MTKVLSIKTLCLVVFILLSLASLLHAISPTEALGEKKFAVVLLDYVNDPENPPPAIGDIQYGFIDSLYSVNEFIKEAS